MGAQIRVFFSVADKTGLANIPFAIYELAVGAPSSV